MPVLVASGDTNTYSPLVPVTFIRCVSASRLRWPNLSTSPHLHISASASIIAEPHIPTGSILPIVLYVTS